MVINHIGTNNSILNKFIAEIRDEAIQKDSLRFRRNIERIGEILGYEFSKSIDYVNQAIRDTLRNKKHPNTRKKNGDMLHFKSRASPTSRTFKLF